MNSHFTHAIVVLVVAMTFSTMALAFIGPPSNTNNHYINRQPPSFIQSRSCSSQQTAPYSSLRMSSIGGAGNNNDKDDNDDNPLNEWIQRKDSENVRRVREQYAEGRLPISYGAMNTDTDTNNNDVRDNNNSEEDNEDNQKQQGRFGPLNNSTTQSSSTNDAIDATSSESGLSSPKRTKPNPYLSIVSNLPPSDLISTFTSTASPRVQDAVRTTVLGLIGGLPSQKFETKTVATGERLASLMFQLQMTGYMFKNAEYRLSLSSSLGSLGSGVGGRRMLPSGDGQDDEDKALVREGRGTLKGKIKVRYGGAATVTSSDNNDNTNSTGNSQVETEVDKKAGDDQEEETTSSTPGMEVEVDAQAYMSELRGEVRRLREELDATKLAKEEEIRKDLLMYIRTLPQQEMQQLTGTMSPDVLEAMKGLVTAVLAGIGDNDEKNEDNGSSKKEGSLGDTTIASGKEGGGVGEDGGGNNSATNNKIGPNTVTEQSGEALAQLCMWQLVVGFNLRELEVREEFRASMGKNMLGEGGGIGNSGSGDDGDGGVQFGPGALE